LEKRGIPVAAYRINKWLSVGGGFSMVYSKYESKTAIRNLVPESGDGRPGSEFQGSNLD
jgi:long-subunit fatty acid transport protein